MDLREATSNWLHEWEAISGRIESINARLWQGAGISASHQRFFKD